jgi:hypothetical protein
MQANHLSTLVYVAFIVWASVLALGGTVVPDGWRNPLPTVIAIVGWLHFAFDRWLWKLPMLYPWFVKQPNLHGTFHATLESTWCASETESQPDPIEAYFVIRQRFSGVSIRMFTKESSSVSLVGGFMHDADGGWALVATYQNTPGPLILHRSPPHFGSLRLTGHQRRPVSLAGEYWTIRNTRGAIRIMGRTRKVLDSFDAARAASYQS